MTSPAIHKTTFIKASPETVWKLLTDKDLLGQWYHPAETDLAADSPYKLGNSENGEPKVWGDVLVFEPFDRLVTTFTIAPLGGRMTTVTWTLNEVEGGTMLDLVHEGIAEAAAGPALDLLMALEAGWGRHLVRLQEGATS